MGNRGQVRFESSWSKCCERLIGADQRWEWMLKGMTWRKNCLGNIWKFFCYCCCFCFLCSGNKHSNRFLCCFSLRPTGLTPNSRYDQVIEAFGGKGYMATTREELRNCFKLCLKETERPSLVNVIISPSAGKKPQVRVVFKFILGINIAVCWLCMNCFSKNALWMCL